MMLDVSVRKKCKQTYQVIAFDIAKSKLIPHQKRNNLQIKMIYHALKIKQLFPQFFVSEAPLISFDSPALPIKGYLLEPFIFGDMWVLTLAQDADVDRILDYFKKVFLPESPFYYQLGFYDSHTPTDNETWTRGDEFQYMNEYMEKTHPITK